MAPLLQQAVRRNIERKCAQQLQDLSNEFRRGHNNFLKKLKGQEIEDFRPDLKLGGGGGAGTSGGGGGFFDDEPAEGQVDPRFNAAQTLQLVMAEQMTEERERAINQVASSVTELAEIFKEIQVRIAMALPAAWPSPHACGPPPRRGRHTDLTPRAPLLLLAISPGARDRPGYHPRPYRLQHRASG